MHRNTPPAGVLADVLAFAELEGAWTDYAERNIAASGHPTNEVATAPSADSKLRDKLARVESEITELRDSLPAAEAKLDAAKQALADAADAGTDSDEFKAAQEARGEVGQIKDDIASKQGEQVGYLQILGERGNTAAAGELAEIRGRAGGEGRAVEMAGWNSAAVLSAEGVAEDLRRISTSKAKFGTMTLGEVIDRDHLAADIAPTSNMRRGEYYGVLPQLFRPLRVLDLLPTGTMDGNSLPYTQESGSFGAAETAEGDLKPEDGVTYTDQTANAETIAAWMKIRKQALADVPALQSIMDNRLRYSVRRRLEGQALNGDGTSPNLRGILQTSGIGGVAFDAGELAADQILSGITNVLMADGEADGVIMNPLDWQGVLKAKADGDGHYYSGGPFSMTPQVLWGVPLIPSRAIPQGMALVGDFMIGAQLFIREGVNVLMSDSDGDDFRRNRVTLLGEMRAALAVWRPAVFTAVDLAA